MAIIPVEYSGEFEHYSTRPVLLQQPHFHIVDRGNLLLTFMRGAPWPIVVYIDSRLALSITYQS